MKVILDNPDYTKNYIENLMKFRGVDDFNHFLNPTDNDLEDQSNFDNILAAAERLKHTIETNGKILIIVDSDCDGFTSSAIIYQYIKLLRPETEIDYILHSGKQHGLEDHIDKLIDKGHVYDLIILPDSSSNDYIYHNRLKEINSFCLVLDHHEVDDNNFSDNAIIVNNQLSKNYKNKELTGAGVTYQFCKFLDKFLGVKFADKFIDIAALGIIGDMGSVLDIENRYIIEKGIHYPTESFLLNTFYDKQAYSITGDSAPSNSKFNEKLTPTAIAFYIVPLINAMIRIGTDEEKERLFEGFINGEKLIPSKKRGAKGQLEKIAVETVRECTNAKNRQNKAKEEAVEKLEIKIHKYGLLENKILFIRLDDEDNFPPELNGSIILAL